MVKVIHRNTGEVLLARGHWCASFWCHFRGLMLRTHLNPDEGLIFVFQRSSIINTTPHMLFMFMPIAILWLDEEQRVVDKKLAKPWRLAYPPAKAALYFIEAHPSLLERVQLGDVLEFER
jgi:uncharacterized membrane protein (UPF0127 family)